MGSTNERAQERGLADPRASGYYLKATGLLTVKPEGKRPELRPAARKVAPAPTPHVLAAGTDKEVLSVESLIEIVEERLKPLLQARHSHREPVTAIVRVRHKRHPRDRPSRID